MCLLVNIGGSYSEKNDFNLVSYGNSKYRIEACWIVGAVCRDGAGIIII